MRCLIAGLPIKPYLAKTQTRQCGHGPQNHPDPCIFCHQPQACIRVIKRQRHIPRPHLQNGQKTDDGAGIPGGGHTHQRTGGDIRRKQPCCKNIGQAVKVAVADLCLALHQGSGRPMVFRNTRNSTGNILKHGQSSKHDKGNQSYF